MVKYRIKKKIPMGFVISFFIYTDAVPKLQIFLVIYTDSVPKLQIFLVIYSDFVSSHSGRSAFMLCLFIRWIEEKMNILFGFLVKKKPETVENCSCSFKHIWDIALGFSLLVFQPFDVKWDWGILDSFIYS